MDMNRYEFSPNNELKQPQSHKWVRIACKALKLRLIQQTSKQKISL